MAYVDLMSPEAYGQYNIKLATLTSLPVAVYFNCILKISDRVKTKAKFDEEGFFRLDRRYVEMKTTLTEEDQLECDNELANLGILGYDPDDRNRIRVDLVTAAAIITDDMIKPNKTLKKKIGESKVQAAERKKLGQKMGMTRIATGIDPDPDLADYYAGWVDAVYANPKGKSFLTKLVIQTFISAINKYAKDNKQVKTDLLLLAAKTGYQEADWVISLYEKEHPVASRLGEQKIATGTRSDVVF